MVLVEDNTTWGQKKYFNIHRSDKNCIRGNIMTRTEDSRGRQCRNMKCPFCRFNVDILSRSRSATDNNWRWQKNQASKIESVKICLIDFMPEALDKTSIFSVNMSWYLETKIFFSYLISFFNSIKSNQSCSLSWFNGTQNGLGLCERSVKHVNWHRSLQSVSPTPGQLLTAADGVNTIAVVCMV